MKKQIFANYGMLGHEKQTVYTADYPGSDIYDVVTVDIPDRFEVYETVTGSSAIIDPVNGHYLLNDTLASINDLPYLSIVSYAGKRYLYKLNILSA